MDQINMAKIGITNEYVKQKKKRYALTTELIQPYHNQSFLTVPFFD